MTVAFNALSLRPGVFDGAATYSLNLLRHLPAACPELEFVVYARPGEDRIPESPNLKLRAVPVRGGAPGRIALELTSLPRLLRTDRVGLLLSPNESVPVTAHCRVVVIAQNVVYHCDGSGERFRGASPSQRLATRTQFAYYRRRMTRAYGRADAVVACSQFAADLLVRRAQLDSRKTSVVLSGSDSLAIPSATPATPSDRLLVVSVLAPHKNLEQTLRVFARLHRVRPDVTLAVAGGDWRGFRTVVEAEIERLGLQQAVTLLGRVPGNELARLYSDSLALLHLSSCESFGLPLLEAMQRGLPVVAADAGPSPEVAAGAALLVDPDQPDVAAARIQELLESPQRLVELRDRGLARAAELTWKRTAAGIADVLRSVLEA